MLDEPRNLKQIRNRQKEIRKSLLQTTNNTFLQVAGDQFHTLIQIPS